jgi:hypothetical protein
MTKRKKSEGFYPSLFFCDDYHIYILGSSIQLQYEEIYYSFSNSIVHCRYCYLYRHRRSEYQSRLRNLISPVGRESAEFILYI